MKRLVEMHGGTASAESPGPDRGSTFVVTIPLASGAPAPQSAPGAPPGAPAPQGARRVLVVDDNADAAESLSELLALSGHTTQTAQNGPDALAAAARLRPEFVFLDIGLPGMNGYEVARALRADPSCGEPVLVALTGWGSDDDRRRSTEAGFDFHLTKPVVSEQLEQLFTSCSRRSA